MNIISGTTVIRAKSWTLGAHGPVIEKDLLQRPLGAQKFDYVNHRKKSTYADGPGHLGKICENSPLMDNLLSEK